MVKVDDEVLCDDSAVGDAPKIVRFKPNVRMHHIRNILRDSSVDSRLQAVTIGYKLTESGVCAYEYVVNYLGNFATEGNESLEIEEMVSCTEYGIGNGEWRVLSRRDVEKREFYDELIYGAPNYVANVQRLVFRLRKCVSVIEIHPESGRITLFTTDFSGKAESLFGEMLECEELSYCDYMREFLSLLDK